MPKRAVVSEKIKPTAQGSAATGGSASVADAMRLFSEALSRLGVHREVIDRAASEAMGKLVTLTGSNGKDISKHYEDERREYRKKHRKDFFGRAVLYHLEYLFPEPDDLAELIHSETIEGKVPREVAAGLIEAIKLSNEEKALIEYQDFFIKKADRYRRRATNEVDYTSFINDGGVRSVARSMVNKFEQRYRGQGEEEQGKQWLLGMIQNAPSFKKKMKRDLSEKEFSAIRNNIFNVR
jgi:hypothetical protein